MASKYDGATMEVINWDKYNGRTDAVHPYWFKLENKIATSESFFDLDCEQKWLWVVILSLVSQKNGEPILWNAKYIQAITKISPKKQDATIKIFEQFVRLRVTRASGVRDSHLEKRREEERREEKKDSCSFDFENLYQKYPRKMGKAKGIEKCQREVKSQEDYDALDKAIYRFCDHHRQTDPKFIPYFSTFMSTWRDWLDPACGQTKTLTNFRTPELEELDRQLGITHATA